jgi:hypothetical protein
VIAVRPIVQRRVFRNKTNDDDKEEPSIERRPGRVGDFRQERTQVDIVGDRSAGF